MSMIHTDPVSGRSYEVGPDGKSRWLDPMPAHGRPQQFAQPAATGPTLVERPAPAKAGARRWLIPAGTGLLGLVLGAGLGGSGSDPAAVTAAGATVTQTATKTVTAAAPAAAVAPAVESAPAPAAAAGVAGDGTYLVGADIKPGTYRSGKPASGMCYWARLKSDSGGVGDIIANDVTAGPSVVTVKKTDKLFKTSGCEDWTRVK